MEKISFKSNFFDRIILSHVLEQILEPEVFLKDMIKKLKKGGILSITLPCDPGVLWRVGKFFLKILSVKKILNISNVKYDYLIASEHINLIFNLKSIIKYKYSKILLMKAIYQLELNLLIKFTDLNLFHNITLRK